MKAPCMEQPCRALFCTRIFHKMHGKPSQTTPKPHTAVRQNRGRYTTHCGPPGPKKEEGASLHERNRRKAARQAACILRPPGRLVQAAQKIHRAFGGSGAGRRHPAALSAPTGRRAGQHRELCAHHHPAENLAGKLGEHHRHRGERQRFHRDHRPEVHREIRERSGGRHRTGRRCDLHAGHRGPGKADPARPGGPDRPDRADPGRLRQGPEELQRGQGRL